LRIGMDEISEGPAFQLCVVGMQEAPEGRVCFQYPRTSFDDHDTKWRVLKNAAQMRFALDKPFSEDGRQQTERGGLQRKQQHGRVSRSHYTRRSSKQIMRADSRKCCGYQAGPGAGHP